MIRFQKVAQNRVYMETKSSRFSGANEQGEMAPVVVSILQQFPVFPLILLPFIPLLLQLTDRVVRCFMGVVWVRCEDQLVWGSSRSGAGSAEPEPGHDAMTAECVNWLFGKKHGARRYHGGAPSQCVICLCDVEEGDEIRELRCDHVFHRGCLDRWVGFGRVTCPLCREPLIGKAPAAELPCHVAVESAELAFDVGPPSPC
ncbi:RING-H2 finger protein ATL18-like [Wolffia australiana]